MEILIFLWRFIVACAVFGIPVLVGFGIVFVIFWICAELS